MLEFLQNWLLGHGLVEGLSFYVARGIAVVAVLGLGVITGFVAKHYIVSALTYCYLQVTHPMG